VIVAQLAEHRVVVPKVAGSSPVGHPGFCRRNADKGPSPSRPWQQYGSSRVYVREVYASCGVCDGVKVSSAIERNICFCQLSED
jgi:hypothetical protein